VGHPPPAKTKESGKEHKNQEEKGEFENQPKAKKEGNAQRTKAVVGISSKSLASSPIRRGQSSIIALHPAKIAAQAEQPPDKQGD
jgi:hypothetical protein